MTRIFFYVLALAAFLTCVTALAELRAVRAAESAPQASPQHRATAAELSRDETPGKAVMRIFESQVYDVRSAAEAASRNPITGSSPRWRAAISGSMLVSIGCAMLSCCWSAVSAVQL